VSRPRID